MGLIISESFVHVDIRYSEIDPHETYFDTIGELFRYLQKEYGRCPGKVYIDTKSGKTFHTGWVFRKIDYYTDTHEPYLCEVWVSVHEKMPETFYHLAHLKEAS